MDDSEQQPALRGCRRIIWLVVLLTLACRLGTPDTTPQGIVMLTRLPTFTPTSPPIIETSNDTNNEFIDDLATVPPTEPTTPLPLPPTALPTVTLSPTPRPPPSPLPGVTVPPTITLPSPSPIATEAPAPVADSTVPPTPTVPATPAPTVLTTPIPTATSLPTNTPAASPPPEAAGWDFSGVRTYPDPFAEGLLVYGDALNNTGSPQELRLISGTFYDDQGQIIATADSIFDYWPVEFVPAGERLPFELTIPGINNATTFDLHIEAQPYAHSLAHDFTFATIDRWTDEASYCLTGQLQVVTPPQEFLVILAVLYDDQDNVVKFAEYYAPDLDAVTPNAPLDFELCVDLTEAVVVSHDLRAWGQ